MENPEAKKLSTVDDVVSHAKDYIKTNVDLFALNVADKTSSFASGTVFYIFLAVIGVFFMFFFSVGTAFALAPVVGGLHISFFFLAGFYLLLAVLAVLMKDKWIKTPVANRIIKQLFKDNKSE
jgi:hypothetical protein